MKSILLIAGVSALVSSGRAQWTSAVGVSSNIAEDGGFAEIAASDDGHWIITWDQSAGGAALFARSENRGQSWGSTRQFDPPTGSITQGAPSIAADVTSGTFMASWQVDFNFDGIADAAIARTTEDLETFPAVNLVGQFSSYFGMALPQIASGGDNVWVTAGISTGPSGGDEALSLFRSTDDGLTWLPVAVLGQETSNIRFDRNADMASDGDGNWVLVTESREDSATSDDIDVRFSSSTNQGETWSALDEVDESESRGERPRVTAGAPGRFLVLQKRGEAAGNLMVYSTTNAGAAWSDESVINLAGLAASTNVLGQDIAADPEGNAVAVWSARDPLGGRNRLFYTTSRDFGASWTPVEYVATPATDISDEWPTVQYDGRGRWAAAWQRRSFGTSTTLSIQSAALVFPIRADISVRQSHEPDRPTVGEAVTYTFTVRNDGPSSATGVRMEARFPAEAEILNVTQTQGSNTQTSGLVTFEVGDLLESASAQGEVEVQYDVGGFYQTTVQATANEEDVDLQDRISTDTTRLLVEGVDLTGEWQKVDAQVPKQPFKGRLKMDSKLVVRNMGNKRSRGFRVLLVFSFDNVLSDDDALATVLSVPHLGPGNERKLDWEPKVRRYIPWQGRQLLAIIDAEMRVDEADEFNNNIGSEPLPAPEAPLQL